MKVHHTVVSVQQVLQEPGTAGRQRAVPVHRHMEMPATKFVASFNIKSPLWSVEGGIS